MNTSCSFQRVRFARSFSTSSLHSLVYDIIANRSMKLKEKFFKILRYSEKYTKTDMVYLAKGGFWLSFGKVVSVILSFLLALAFANLVSKETYGTYKYILSLGGILAIFTLPEISTSLIRSIARGYEGSFIPALKTRLRWGILTTLASGTLSVYYFIHDNSLLAVSFLIMAFFLPFLSSFETYSALWQGRKKFDVSAKYNIISQLFPTLALIIALFLTKNVLLILLIYYFSYTLSHFILLRLTIKKADLSKGKDPATIPYGKHLTLMNVIGLVAKNIDKILLWHFLGAIPLAIYSFAIVPVEKIGDVLRTTKTLALPKLSQKKELEIKKTLLRKILKFFLIIIPVVFLYIILSPLLYKIALPQYLDSIPYSQIFALTLLFVPIGLLSTFLTAQMKKKELYQLSIIPSIIKIVFLFILLPLYGIWGAIWAILISQFISLGFLLFLFKKS